MTINVSNGMRKNFFRCIFLIGTTFILGGCGQHFMSPTNSSSVTEINRPIYLRGVFTWWDAEPQYQMHPVANKKGLWMTEAELIADGHPYEWKIGDKQWHCGTDFGYKSDDSLIVENTPRVVDNCAKFNSLKFVPKKDGIYQFYLDVRGAEPVVYVKRKNSK